MDNADASVIWHKIYENLLFEIEHERPMFWVIDALDECDSPKLLLDFMRTCSRTSVPLQIFIASRQTESIETGLAKYARSLRLTKLEKRGLDHKHKTLDV